MGALTPNGVFFVAVALVYPINHGGVVSSWSFLESWGASKTTTPTTTTATAEVEPAGTTPNSTTAEAPSVPSFTLQPDIPRLPRDCVEEPEEGECGPNERGEPSFPYFYDAAEQKCDIFRYSGCNGNGNNFETEEECLSRCKVGTPYDLKEDARLPAVCKQRAVVGTCVSGREPELRYFYNMYDGKCELFPYSGCQGNENNFLTLEDCKARCIFNPDGVCVLPPEKGPCPHNFTRYHWDKELGNCKPFMYGGCGGNDNNFPSMKKCREFCKGRSTFLELWWDLLAAILSWKDRGFFFNLK